MLYLSKFFSFTIFYIKGDVVAAVRTPIICLYNCALLYFHCCTIVLDHVLLTVQFFHSQLCSHSPLVCSCYLLSVVTSARAIIEFIE